MLLLITDTSGKQGSVALARAHEHAHGDEHEHKDKDKDDASAPAIHLLEAVPLAGGMFSAQLVPQIASLLTRHSLSKTDIDAFIVISGPGSFTGLRVGLAAIKALAEILHKPIVPVSLLEVIALAANAEGRIFAALDAGRGELYVGEYEVHGADATLLRELLLPKSAFLELVHQSAIAAVATPDPSLLAGLQESVRSVVALESPTAEQIARLGLRKLRAGESVSPEQLEANYIRRTDAEILSKGDLRSR
jgi:tRNA threonylcarbamoyladenosine biosynthesis protein TsaB